MRKTLQNSYFELVKKNSQEIILYFDNKGTVIDCNNIAMDELGYGEELIGASIYNIFRKAIKVDNGLPGINSKYYTKASETTAYRKDQTCFAVSLKVDIFSQNKLYIGVCTAVNITEKKQALHDLKIIKAELRASRQIKHEFVAKVTHELRTPVNGIMGLSENLLETELTAKQLEAVNIIHQCCKNMNMIINDLLDFSSTVNKKIKLVNDEFNFQQFMERLVTLNINKIHEKGLKLVVNVANDIPRMLIGDECRLTQILNNLLTNAIKFTAVGQVVLEVVKTAQTNKYIELFFMVIDTGIGISDDDKDYLFNSFYQVESSISRKFGGTGLGLSICKMLVEAMHGTIAVESIMGEGSTFSFSVRLGISGKHDNTFINYLPDESGVNEKKKYTYSIPEADYAGKLFEDAFSIAEQYDKHKSNENVSSAEVKQNISNTIEKILICMEMDSWNKAEELALSLRLMIPGKYKALRDKSLSLLLAVRKEEKEASIRHLNTLTDLISEVTEWTI